MGHENNGQPLSTMKWCPNLEKMEELAEELQVIRDGEGHDVFYDPQKSPIHFYTKSPSNIDMGERREGSAQKSLRGLVYFFNFTYYTCFTPFRLIELGGQYCFHRTKVQTIFCYLVMCLVLLEMVGYVREFEAANGKENIAQYFALVLTLSATLHQILRAYLLLKKRHIFIEIGNISLKGRRGASNLSEDMEEPSHALRTKLGKITQNIGNLFGSSPAAFTILMVSAMVCCFVCESYDAVTQHSTFDDFVNITRKISNKRLGPFIRFDDDQPISPMGKALLVAIFLNHSLTLYVFLMSDAMFIIIFRFYGQLVDNFMEEVTTNWGKSGQIKATSHRHCHQVITHLTLVQKIVELINSGVGGYFLTSILWNLMFNVEFIPNLIQTSDSFSLYEFRLMFYCSYCLGSLLYVARKYAKLEKCLKNWISRPENYGGMGQDKLSILLSELTWGRNLTLSLAGMHDINQALFISVASVIITYGTIKIQIQNDK